tara:strand:+ start:1338 stop:2348 length:1011 start_codon:yes stop_codon:yes gene_type:complete
MTNKAQQDLLNQLNEYRQTQQLDEIGDFTKAIAKKVGQGVGAVKGAGQKVKGVAQRSAAALGNAYTQGQTGAQKKVAGQDYKAPASKAQAQTQVKKPGLLKRAAGAVSTGIGKADAFAQKALDKVDDASNYNPYKDNPMGDRSQQTYTGVGGAQIGKNAKSSNLTQKNQVAGAAAGLQKADAEAQRKAGLEKKLGTTGAAATATNTAKTATDKSIARNQKKNAKQKTGGISQGIKNATNQQMVSTGVLGPDGKMTMRPAIDKNKDGKDDKNGKPISKTATDVKNKANVTAGGVKMDPSNPQHQALIAAIEKASPGTTKAIDALDPPSKEKLKKAIA